MIKQYKGIEYVANQTKPLLNWCGYVKIPAKHPWLKYVRKIKSFSFMGKTYKHHDYDKVPVECHGGLTFAGYFPKNKGIYTKGWWIGWDYAHAGDFVEGMTHHANDDQRYSEKDIERDCKNVIEQLLNSEKK